jgi:ABC-2 type transport system permease protein
MALAQIALSYFLWHGLYQTTAVTAGLNVDQAVGYAVLAALVIRVRWGTRLHSRESMWSLMRDGRIVYWFLRPISPRRYYLLRSLGEIGYWGCWAAVGFVVAVATGVVGLPASPARAAVAAVSFLAGQVLAHQLVLCIDLMCFWTTANHSAMRVYNFGHDLLAGAFVPLWFLPHWLLVTARWLPFQGTLNVPVSLYVGRLSLADAPREIGVQLAWCCVLLVVTRILWRRAGSRIGVQGG